MSMYKDITSTVGSVPTIAERLGGWPPKSTSCSAIATSVSTIGPRSATAYQKGATRQRTTRPSKERRPARPLSWAVSTTAASMGPKAPRNKAGTGSEEIMPRASSAASNQKVQVKANAKRTNLRGNAPLVVVVVRDDVVAVVVAISLSPFLWSAC